ncbi:unnamed protein product [Larinioides sclopetarius]|uniref:Uncharacterized protein n=1 Tax=Larinioides sclopetarius TaxID=280406 RepID=A0AAV1YUC2_9ARAC
MHMRPVYCTDVLEKVYKSGDAVHSWSSGDCGAPLPPPMGSSQAIRSISEERVLQIGDCSSALHVLLQAALIRL